RLAGGPLAFVERKECGFGHVDLAAHLADVGNALASELLRDVFERFDVRGDVLALGAVAAGGAAYEQSAFVAQRQREPVNLRFRDEHDRLVRLEAEKSPDAIDEIGDVLARKGVAE